jgi:hypothetical protein
MIQLKIHRLIFTAFAYFFIVNARSQFHEIGAFIGSSNYIGDIGTDKYIHPNSPALGLVYKWNTTDRFSLRAGFTFSKLEENEFRNRDLNRFRRSYKLSNNIQEAMVGIEINFFEFNLHDETLGFTPYIFYGVSYFRYEQFYLTPNGPFDPPTYNNYGSDEKIAFPLILGFKINPNPIFVIALEMGARYTLTDNLDGSNPENEFADIQEYKFGNIMNNDWYIFTGLTISFTFGDLPCYCKD